MKTSYKKILFILGLFFCASPWGAAPYALVLGIIIAFTIGNPFPTIDKKASGLLLQVSVVGLGFGMTLSSAVEAGQKGFLFTLATIVITLALGYLVGKLFKIEKNISYLISCGTAICGGSAIAAIAPIIKSDKEQISVALGTVFILNSLALIIFPFIAGYFHMSQHEFGTWAAIAIHDTSSVVGAAGKYGNEALSTAITIKLARALWIVPLAILTSFIFKSESKVRFPYFILYFILAMVLNSFVPQLNSVFQVIAMLAKKGLILALFLIGTSLSRTVIKNVGIKPFLQGVLLWIFISVFSFYVISKTI